MTVREVFEGGRHKKIYSDGDKTITVTEINKDRYWQVKVVEGQNIQSKCFDKYELVELFIGENKWKLV